MSQYETIEGNVPKIAVTSGFGEISIIAALIFDKAYSNPEDRALAAHASIAEEYRSGGHSNISEGLQSAKDRFNAVQKRNDEINTLANMFLNKIVEKLNSSDLSTLGEPEPLSINAYSFQRIAGDNHTAKTLLRPDLPYSSSTSTEYLAIEVFGTDQLGVRSKFLTIYINSEKDAEFASNVMKSIYLMNRELSQSATKIFSRRPPTEPKK
jgi:hypothetical protein